jgi:glutathione S-transferase
MEEHTYFVLAWLRWSGDASWPRVREYFLSILPPVIGPLVIGVFRKQFLKSIVKQGVGRHTRDEVLAMAREDLDAYSLLLGDEPFFLGSEPTSLDATMYGFLVNLHGVPWEAPEKAHFMTKANLVAYVERMAARYWSS